MRPNYKQLPHNPDVPEHNREIWDDLLFETTGKSYPEQLDEAEKWEVYEALKRSGNILAGCSTPDSYENAIWQFTKWLGI